MKTFAKTSTTEDFLNLNAESKRIKLLREPSGYVSALAMDNLGYQMQASVEMLEEQLVQEGNPHVLQLNLQWKGDNWRNPTAWHLYADGALVANGSGDYARSLFLESAEAFMYLCRKAVEAARLEALSEHDYRMLSYARAIAAHEPPAGDGSLGSRCVGSASRCPQEG